MTKFLSNPFSGKWIVLKSEYKKPDGSWGIYQYYRFAEYTWTFEVTKTIQFKATGHISYYGTLKDLFLIDNIENRDFCYFANESELSIDASYYDNTGYMLECYEDRFRVYRLDDSTFVLYPLEDVENEPEDYLDRLIVKKWSVALWIKEIIIGCFIPKRKL